MAVARSWRMTRGNRLRLFAVFLLLTVVLEGLDQLVSARDDLADPLVGGPADMDLEAASIRYLIDFPFNMLWTVVWAVDVGMVLDALEGPSPVTATDRDRSVPQPRARMSHWRIYARLFDAYGDMRDNFVTRRFPRMSLRSSGLPERHNRRSATSSTRWLAPFLRMRSARWRVGRMFSCRLTRLMRVQIEVAVSTASSSDRVA